MGFLDGLFSFLGGLGGIGQEIAQIFITLVNLIAEVFVFLWHAIVDVFNILLKAGQAVAKGLRFVWDHFFSKLFTSVVKFFRAAHDWLETHLKPVIDFLKAARAAYERWFNTFIKPFLNVLQHVRRIIGVFRLLHLHFADHLDDVIAKIEGKVVDLALKQIAVYNSLIDAINGLTDPLALLRHPVLVISIRRSIATISRAVTGFPIGFFFPNHDKNAPPEEKPLSFAEAFEGRVRNWEPQIDEATDGFPGAGFLEAEAAPPDDNDIADLVPLGWAESLAPAPTGCVAEIDLNDHAGTIKRIAGRTGTIGNSAHKFGQRILDAVAAS